jgi:hypothetical protein
MSSTTVISQQPSEIQSLCNRFTESYAKHRKSLLEWGKLLLAIKESKLNPVDAKGEPFDGKDPREQTFTAICGELGLPRSTAYHYLNAYLVTSKYPEWLQQAAETNQLNLAARHVQDAFGSMRESIPASPDNLQVIGIVNVLKKAKPAGSETSKKPKEKFAEMLKEALAYANKHKLLDDCDAAVVELQGDERAQLKKLLEILSAVKVSG